MPKESAPDKVTHDQVSAIPFMPVGIGPTIYSTEISKGDDTYTRCGWTEKEAKQKAGEAYNEGKPDKK
jgi:hypothetical protein